MKQMFYGGVHPAEHKEATEQKPIQPLANAPAQVVIPMSMLFQTNLFQNSKFSKISFRVFYYFLFPPFLVY